MASIFNDSSYVCSCTNQSMSKIWNTFQSMRTWCNSEIFLQLYSGVFCTGGMGMVLKLKILITDSRWMSLIVRSSLLKIIHCLSCQTHHWTILSVDADCWANLAKLKSPLKGCIFNFSPLDNDSFKQFYRKRNLNSKLNLNVSCT